MHKILKCKIATLLWLYSNVMASVLNLIGFYMQKKVCHLAAENFPTDDMQTCQLLQRFFKPRLRCATVHESRLNTHDSCGRFSFFLSFFFIFLWFQRLSPTARAICESSFSVVCSAYSQDVCRHWNFQFNFETTHSSAFDSKKKNKSKRVEWVSGREREKKAESFKVGY